MKVILLFLATLSTLACTARQTVIVHICDPQFGFTSANKDVEYESKQMQRVVDMVNELMPDMVIFGGDMVNRNNSEQQYEAFKNTTSKLNPSIEVHYIVGNHDVAISGGWVSGEPFKSRFGEDRFSIVKNGALIVGFNSVLLKNETKEPAKEQQQLEWLRKELSKKAKVKLLFCHHPLFLRSIDEAQNYSVLDKERRVKYFNLFADNNVKAIFAAHLRDNAGCEHNGIKMITTTSTGKQLGKAKAGVRIITINGKNISETFREIATD